MDPQRSARHGKSLRSTVPRDSHAGFSAARGRADPVALLEEQATSRVPELVPVRYGRMLVSPFSYFRGAALPMAADLARTPVTGLRVQACGDAHLSNFGLFATPERNLTFDLNDFDETLAAPWEWDVKRLAASLEIAARDNGFSRKQRSAIVLAAAARYRQAMADFAAMGNLGVWYARADLDPVKEQFAGGMRSRQRKAVATAEEKARTRDSTQALAKLTCRSDGALRIAADPPLVVPYDQLLPQQIEGGFDGLMRRVVTGYRRSLGEDLRLLLERYEFVDLARKVVGVGSVGTRCWIVLMLGRDQSDPLFLQVKEAQESVLARYAGASPHSNQGKRVVSGQRLMQAASDIFLGWHRVDAPDGVRRDFYVRQLRDWKYSFPIDSAVPRGMRLYGELCGWTLARAHARTGDRFAIAGYLGRSSAFDQAIAEFASACADQNEKDHAALAAAVKAGRMHAEPA